MNDQSSPNKYLIRDSFFNIVELSLLARLYEEHCVPKASTAPVNPQSLTQTLLKMKASEKNGFLKVIICDADPVGFYWNYEGTVLARWIHPAHQQEDLKKELFESTL